MITLKSNHHFYAAHRNNLLDDKCKFLHGHTYMVEIGFRFNTVNEKGVTMLFKEVDLVVDKKIKEYDHATLVDTNDRDLMNVILNNPEIFGKFKVVDGPTSLENLAKQIYVDMIRMALPVEYVELKETLTKGIKYDG